LFFALDKWVPLKNPNFSFIIPEVIGVLIMYVIHGPLQLALARKTERYSSSGKSQNEEKRPGRQFSMQKFPFFGSSFVTTAAAVNENSSLSPTLDDVLQSLQGCTALEAFLISIWASESLRFYLEAAEWTLDFHDMGYRTALSRAKRILRVFIDVKGSMAVNLNHEIVAKLKSVLQEETPHLSQDLFAEAISEILKLMRSDTFLRFKETSAYKDFAEAWRRGDIEQRRTSLTGSPRTSGVSPRFTAAESGTMNGVLNII
jgi:hypothetical protein